MFRPTHVESWARAVEIGQGTGKYTRLVLEGGVAEVLACDVSRVFLASCRRRLASFVESGRLHFALIEEYDPRSIQRAVHERGWERIDALYSIDAFVHLPFAAIASYMLAGTEVLAPGGYLIFSFADGTSPLAQPKLLADLDNMIERGSDPSIACFHWTAPQLMRVFAERIGFEVLLSDVDPTDGRDGHFVARFADRSKADAARAMRAKRSDRRR
jgi:SAM-dependent methyltransferase